MSLSGVSQFMNCLPSCLSEDESKLMYFRVSDGLFSTNCNHEPWAYSPKDSNQALPMLWTTGQCSMIWFGNNILKYSTGTVKYQETIQGGSKGDKLDVAELDFINSSSLENLLTSPR